MYYKNLILFFGISILLFGKLKAATYTFSVANGAWGTTTNWSPAGTPTCGDIVIIPCGRTTSVTGNIDLTGCATPLNIIVSGVLWFTQGKKLRLPCGSTVNITAATGTCAGTGSLVPENPVGSNNQLEICGDDVWVSGDGTVTGPLILLPIELLYFTADVCNHNMVCLNWATATEKNNSYFTVERSTDGIEFNEVTKIPGAGTSYVTRYYNTIDERPLIGISYYRLKQTDFDNTFVYYPMAAIALDFEIFVQNPSPAHDIPLTIKGNKGDEFEIILVDVLGRIVYNEKTVLGITGHNKISINLYNRLSSGVVYLLVNSNLKKAQIKVVID